MQDSGAKLVVIKSFYIAGVQHRPANIIDPLGDNEEIRFTAEPENKFDQKAIKIVAKFTSEVEKDVGDTDKDPQVGIEVTWEHIGYVPKADTWIYHLLRCTNTPVYLKLDVNPSAEPYNRLLVTVAVAAIDTPFICHSYQKEPSRQVSPTSASPS